MCRRQFSSMIRSALQIAGTYRVEKTPEDARAGEQVYAQKTAWQHFFRVELSILAS
jgi:hypothetical protein